MQPEIFLISSYFFRCCIKWHTYCMETTNLTSPRTYCPDKNTNYRLLRSWPSLRTVHKRVRCGTLLLYLNAVKTILVLFSFLRILVMFLLTVTVTIRRVPSHYSLSFPCGVLFLCCFYLHITTPRAKSICSAEERIRNS
jgi:hypothetical protein